MHLTTVRCCVLLQLTVLRTRKRLLPDFGRIVQNKRLEEDKDRRTWNSQVSFRFFYIVWYLSSDLSSVYIYIARLTDRAIGFRFFSEFLSVIWVKWKQSVCSMVLSYSSAFYSLFLPLFILEIFKFKYGKFCFHFQIRIIWTAAGYPFLLDVHLCR